MLDLVELLAFVELPLVIGCLGSDLGCSIFSSSIRYSGESRKSWASLGSVDRAVSPSTSLVSEEKETCFSDLGGGGEADELSCLREEESRRFLDAGSPLATDVTAEDELFVDVLDGSGSAVSLAYLSFSPSRFHAGTCAVDMSYGGYIVLMSTHKYKHTAKLELLLILMQLLDFNVSPSVFANL